MNVKRRLKKTVPPVFNVYFCRFCCLSRQEWPNVTNAEVCGKNLVYKIFSNSYIQQPLLWTFVSSDGWSLKNISLERLFSLGTVVIPTLRTSFVRQICLFSHQSFSLYNVFHPHTTGSAGVISVSKKKFMTPSGCHCKNMTGNFLFRCALQHQNWLEHLSFVNFIGIDQ